MNRTLHLERHRTDRIGWLRAAVLGANDGIVSVASLIVGVASAQIGRDELFVAGAAGLVAGAMSMAAGEYVSVSSQADTERSDLSRERAELLAEPELEKQELASIYRERGLSPELARQVAEQLMTHDALGAHARDELGVSPALSLHPLRAAITSAGCFAVGAALPLLTTLATPAGRVAPVVAVCSLLSLALLGALAARTGGAPVLRAAVRVTVLGALAMGLTALAGRLSGTGM